MKKYMILIIVISIIFSGCWDSRELNELGLVMAVGIDKGKEENSFLVTVQIAKPKEGSSGQGGGGEAVWVGSAEGNTIFDAIRNVATFSSRRIMWAHNNVIIIGEGLAEQGITPVIDFFSHNPELRMKTWVAIAKGEAREYVMTKTGIEDIPAISIARLYLYNELPAKSIRTDMVGLFRDYKSDTINPIVSALNMVPPGEIGSSSPQVELAGSAVFKKDKMEGWLSPEDTRGIAWVRGQTKNSVISVSGTGMQEKRVGVEVRSIKVKTISEIKDEEVSFKIDVRAEGSINEQDVSRDIGIEEFKNEIEKLVNDKIENEIKSALEKVQKNFNSDVIGLGRIVHIQHKRDWYSGIGEKWPEFYSKAIIEVNADVDINMSALFQVPIKNEKIQGESDNENKN